MIAYRLKTQNLIDPIGIDALNPVLSWNCAEGIRQTAYRIIAETDNGILLWDSEKRESTSMHCRWEGKAVPAETRVLWKICLWDENNEAGEWTSASFETGIQNWRARWISGDYRAVGIYRAGGNYRADGNYRAGGNYPVIPKKRYPVDCFRKKFLAEKIKKARLYITACGLYEARINGKKAGNFILAPGITDYRKRIQYQTIDVTELLQEGENELTVQLADGWYRGSCGAWGIKNQYGTETKLLAQLVMTRVDGTKEELITDESWDWSNDGPIRFADNKDGEIADARRKPSYYKKAKVTAHSVIPAASNNVSVTEHEHLSAVLITTPSGKKVLDFGQNIAGYVKFCLHAKAGQRVFLRYGELLDENGEFTQQNIQCHNKKITTPLQQVEYFCCEGENHYKTTFAIFGFRYVQVETDVPFAAENFTAIAVSSDMERTGWFESSNSLLNRLFENTVWSAKNNHADLPTDCPTRERHGWTGDAQIFCSTASYLFDYRSMAEKFLNDMYDWQRKDGCLPQIAPSGGTDFYMYTMNGSVGWADAGIVIPYVLWKQYGDIEILKRYYAGMKRYAGFMMRRCGKWGGPYAKPVKIPGKYKKYLVNCGQSYGEWAEPQDVYQMHFLDFAGPHPEVSTAYTAYMMDLMAQIAGALGRQEDISKYEQYRDGCRETYQILVRTKDFSLNTDRQAQLVRPLALGLLTEKEKKYARKRLIRALDHYGWRLGTGFLSTPLILDVLTEIHPEAAYRLLENEEMPGWLFMPKNGATTIWESWEGDKAAGSGVASLDHYSKGAVCRWLFDTMCGIRVEGENHFRIAPVPGGRFTHANARYDSVYGRVESGWQKHPGNDSAEDNTTGTITFTVTIPANCTAEIILPDGFTQEVGPGNYSFERSIGKSSGRSSGKSSGRSSEKSFGKSFESSRNPVTGKNKMMNEMNSGIKTANNIADKTIDKTADNTVDKTIDKTINQILAGMTLEDKIALCSGADFWHTKAMEKYGIPEMMLSDGSHGMRKQERASGTDMLGINVSVPATCFPASALTASGFDPAVTERIGHAIGEEAAAMKVGVVLGPGANLKRNPLCGRNFEYFSEDPYLSGKMAAGWIRGAESAGVASSLKHFACNNQEKSRFNSDSIIDERTLRELYLTGYEIAVKEGKPSTVMSAYNKINGNHCSDSRELLTGILRDEWGFDGLVVTDWGGMSDRIAGFSAGCDLSMPGGSDYMEKETAEAVRTGKLKESDIDRSAGRILKAVLENAAFQKTEHSFDAEAHHAIARQAAEESAVLLKNDPVIKNDSGILPLKAGQKIVLIGAMAKNMRYQGAGSSHINPTKVVSPCDAMPEFAWSCGCLDDGTTTDRLISDAVDAAEAADVAVVFAGLPDRCESEGFDRDNMKMPEGHLRLIDAVSKANKNTVVVLFCGCAVECPWADQVGAILYMGLPGQAGGEAVRNLLLGKVNPSGRLAESWPMRYEDCPSSDIYAKEKDALYCEGIYVGYRYYEKAGIPVRFPFGHGLSYTTFAYSDLKADCGKVSVTVTNTGKIAGAETVLLWIAANSDHVSSSQDLTDLSQGLTDLSQGHIHRPVRELKGFRKVFLEPQESRTVTFTLDSRSFAVWEHGWKVPEGEYIISAGDLSAQVAVSGENVPAPDWQKDSWYENCAGKPTQKDLEKSLGKKIKLPVPKKGSYTMDNTVMEMKDHSLVMKIMYKAVESTVAKGFDGKKDYTNPDFRMMMNSSAGAPLRSMQISGGMKGGVFKGLLEMANGHYLRGIIKMIR